MWLSFHYDRSLSSKSQGFIIRITQGCTTDAADIPNLGNSNGPTTPGDGGSLVTLKTVNTVYASSNGGNSSPITLFHQFNSTTTGANKINVYAKSTGGSTSGTYDKRDVMAIETKR